MVDSDAPVSGPDAAAYLTEHTPSRVTPEMVRKWASRGWKTLPGPNGEKPERRKLTLIDYGGERGAARYRWGDLADAERDTRKNPKSPGRGRPKELVAA